MDWIELVSKALVFASFWFLAPKLAGEERLKAITTGTLSTIAWILGCVVWIVVLTVFAIGLYCVFPLWLDAQVEAPKRQDLLNVGPKTPEWLDVLHQGMSFVILGIFSVAATASGLTRTWFNDRVVRKWLARLAESRSLRSVWARIGLWLFSLGSVFDMVWWLVKKIFGFH